MFNIVDINNSFSYIETDIPDMYSKIMQQLTFSVPNAQFTPSYRDGTWNGLKTFYRVYNNVLIIPKGITPLVIQKFKQHNPTYNPISLDEYILPTFIEFKQFVKDLNIGFEPYDYQIQAAYDSICKKRQTNLLATSAGKSLVIYLITKWLYKHNIKTVLIFPSIMLVSQIYESFKEYENIKSLYKLKEKYEKHWDKSLSQENLIEVQNEILQKEQFLLDIHLIGGDNNVKHFDLPITATTWQSVYDSPELFKDIQAIIIDEAHNTKSNSMQNIMDASINSSIRLGFTGTLPPSIIEKIEIISALGPKHTYITAQQLIDRGLACPVTINCCFLKYNQYDSNRINGLKYQDEIKALYKHEGRIEIIKKLLTKLQSQGNTIVLFDRIELAETVLESIHGEWTDINTLRTINPTNHMLITSKTKSKERDKMVKYMEENNNCIIFGTSSIMSTGISIKKLNSLVFLSSSKSPIRVVQSVGRVIRLHPEIKHVNVYDLIDDCRVWNKNIPKNNYSYTHFEERLAIYGSPETGYPLKEILINVP